MKRRQSGTNHSHGRTAANKHYVHYCGAVNYLGLRQAPDGSNNKPFVRYFGTVFFLGFARRVYPSPEKVGAQRVGSWRLGGLEERGGSGPGGRWVVEKSGGGKNFALFFFFFLS